MFSFLYQLHQTTLTLFNVLLLQFHSCILEQTAAYIYSEPHSTSKHFICWYNSCSLINTLWMSSTGVQKVFSKTPFDPMQSQRGLQDHFWNADHNPLLSQSKRLGTISSCWHNKKKILSADARLFPLLDSFATLWHKLHCVLCSESHSKEAHGYMQMHILGNGQFIHTPRRERLNL